jgi:hypothetical protein
MSSAILLIGFAGIGFMTYRQKSKPESMAARSLGSRIENTKTGSERTFCSWVTASMRSAHGQTRVESGNRRAFYRI